MHRSIRETPLYVPPPRKRVGLDILDLAGRLVGTSDHWDGIIELIGTLPSGQYHVLCSAGQRLAFATVEQHRSVGQHREVILRIFRP